MRTTVYIEPNKVFSWKVGACLVSKQPVQIVFPGSLIRNDEAVGSIIDVSDDNARIAFVESQDGASFVEIDLYIQANTAVRLHRGTQAVLRSDSPTAIEFDQDD